MIIKFSPCAGWAPVVVTRKGDILTIDNEVFDFTPLPEGATLPPGSINSDHIVDSVSRIDGVIHITLISPVDFDSSEKLRFPEALVMNEDGIVEFPNE